MSPTLPATARLDEISARSMALTASLWGAHAAAAAEAARHAGGMSWRRGRLGERLVRLHPASRLDGRRQEEDLGPRSPETEAIRKAWDEGRARAAADMARTMEAMRVQADVNRGLGLGGLPRQAGGLLRALDADGMLGTLAAVVGPALLHAYGAEWGLRLGGGPRDPLAGARQSLSLVALGDPGPVLASVRRADPSVRATRVPGRWECRDGFMLDLAPVADLPRWRGEAEVAAFRGVAVDDAGMPAPMAGPSPRAFVAERLRAAAEGGGDEDSLAATLQARAAVACLAASGQRADSPGSARAASA